MNYASDKKERKSVSIPRKLIEQAEAFVHNSGMSSLSELISVALAEYFDRLGQLRFEKEMAEGYQANKEYYEKMSEEWKFADSE